MLWKLKTKKSAGVAVTRKVHSTIRAANRARDAGDWERAALYFEDALRQAPDLYHIWIQLGHASRQSGAFARAEEAYRIAADMRPGSGEPHLHMGHLNKVAGRGRMAGEAFFQAVKREPSNPDALAELHRQVAQSMGPSRETMLDLLRSAWPLSQPDADTAPSPVSNAATSVPMRGNEADAGMVTFFDVSDLVAYYGRARLPSGIQRVQIETIIHAFSSGGDAFRICCVFEGRDEWVDVPASRFVELINLSLESGDREEPVWRRALNGLYMALVLADPLEFPDGACLVNLGTSWWLQNYFLHVRNAQIAHHVKYVPLIFDLIPVLMPEHCIDSLVRNFITWLVGVFDHAAGFLVISEATKRDLLLVAERLGHDLDPALVEVVPLDADFRKPASVSLDAGHLAKWQLGEGNFVLFVSTIESRKGHQVAFDAWLLLLERLGASKVPTLVCVGANGWLNDRVYEMLAEHPELKSRVTMLSGLSDDELALLYRSCLFTIYPSLYEGWGLPITEAFCYGKAVIASNSSSLPEAGGRLAIYVAAGSPQQLAREVERLSFDAPYREDIEEMISREFHPRSWQDVASQIRRTVAELVTKDVGNRAPAATVDAYHSLGGVAQLRVWAGLRSGEVFRIGTGWLWPESWGCWARPEGGELRIGLAPRDVPWRMYLHVQAPPEEDCRWWLRVNGEDERRGVLAAGERRWLAFDCISSGEEPAMHLHVGADLSQTVALHRGDFGAEAPVSIGVRGFFVHERDDGHARAAFLEAIALNAVDDLKAYGEMIAPTAELNRVRGAQIS